MRRHMLPIEELPAWIKLNDVQISDVQVTRLNSNAMSGIVANNELRENEHDILMVVPRELVLSLELVEQYAKPDKDLRKVLDALGDFARAARGAILTFLIMQMTIACSDVNEKIGVSTPWTQYIKFLPSAVPLPTFYTDEERELLHGLSLEAALNQKLISLEREFELLRECTEQVPWCSRHWWDDEAGLLTFDDWKLVDALYRSRALDLPGTGHAMVPCIDMANHASGDETVASYETDLNRNAVLQLREGKTLERGDEITITYGDEKGACEMVFSYGFLEVNMMTARELFLDLDIPDDDPLRVAKKAVCKEAPGFRLYIDEESLDWEGAFVWWSCINEEDGLEFRILQSNNGEQELKVAWKGTNLDSSGRLEDILAQDPIWDVFQLRAVVTLQTRVENQMTRLVANNENILGARSNPGVHRQVYDTIVKLSELEWDLLSKAYQDFENQVRTQKTKLLDSETVQRYLGLTAADASNSPIEEDFS